MNLCVNEIHKLLTPYANSWRRLHALQSVSAALTRASRHDPLAAYRAWNGPAGYYKAIDKAIHGNTGEPRWGEAGRFLTLVERATDRPQQVVRA